MFRLFLSAPLSDSALASWATPDERAYARTLDSERRRREWLSWRAIVRQEVAAAAGCAAPEVQLTYNEVGAPRIENFPLHLSVSHCAGSVAVALSEAPCAVDVESLDRDFGRVASRYMTPAEAAACDDPRWPAVVWSAKETLYKFAGRRELDLLCDLQVERPDWPAGTLVGRIGGDPALMLRFFFLAGRVVVYRSE